MTCVKCRIIIIIITQVKYGCRAPLSEITKKNKISPEAKKKIHCYEGIPYPTGAQFKEDASSAKSHSAVSTELAKAKPRDSVLLPLMNHILHVD